MVIDVLNTCELIFEGNTNLSRMTACDFHVKSRVRDSWVSRFYGHLYRCRWHLKRERYVRVVKLHSRSQWNDGYGADTGTSRGDPVGPLSARWGHSSNDRNPPRPEVQTETLPGFR